LISCAQECYTCLPQKTTAFFEAVAAAYYADWVVKMDDDVYLNPQRLRLVMKQWNAMRAEYIGCMKHGVVHHDPSSKWFEPAGLLIGPEYHMNAFGSIYVASGRVVDDVIIPNKERLRQLANEGAAPVRGGCLRAGAALPPAPSTLAASWVPRVLASLSPHRWQGLRQPVAAPGIVLSFSLAASA
jgi:Galactosyltransferase